MLVNAVLSLVLLFCGFHVHTSAVEDHSWGTVRAVLPSPFSFQKCSLCVHTCTGVHLLSLSHGCGHMREPLCTFLSHPAVC